MDDNAQTPPVSTPPPVQPPILAQPDPKQTQPAQPVSRPMEPPPGGPRGVEQGPVRSGPPAREAAPIDEADAVPPAASDDSSDVIDAPNDTNVSVEVQAAPEQAIEVKESHPKMEVPPALQQAGVAKGSDEKPDEEQLDIPVSPEQQQANAKQKMAESLTLDYPQAVKQVKASSTRDSRKWFADLIKRQWEILFGKP